MHITLTVGVCMQVIDIIENRETGYILTLAIQIFSNDEGCGGTENDFFQGTNRTITTTVNH